MSVNIEIHILRILHGCPKSREFQELMLKKRDGEYRHQWFFRIDEVIDRRVVTIRISECDPPVGGEQNKMIRVKVVPYHHR